jgi:hypothetical protein
MADVARLQISRAQRFQMHIPLQYRATGIPDWHDGRTVNISYTGILIRADESLPLSATLDIRLHFPLKVTVSCQGSVVRSEESGFAVRIHRYRLHRI